MCSPVDHLSTAARACPQVSSVIALAETDSTNAVGLRAAQDGAPDFTVILTANQRAGRGRHDRVWESPAGSSLTFSVLLRPSLAPVDWGHLPLLTGLAVCEGLTAWATARGVEGTDAIGLKWPNDVLIDGLKVCGVLLETHVADGTSVDAANGVVAGIGINVDWRGRERPEAFAGRATSLAEWVGSDVDAGEVLTHVLDALHRLWTTVGHDPDACVALVRERCITIGRSVTAHGTDRHHGTVTGTAIGLTPQGHLVIMPDTVNSNDNTPVVVRAADVEHLR